MDAHSRSPWKPQDAQKWSQKKLGSISPCFSKEIDPKFRQTPVAPWSIEAGRLHLAIWLRSTRGLRGVSGALGARANTLDLLVPTGLDHLTSVTRVPLTVDQAGYEADELVECPLGGGLSFRHSSGEHRRDSQPAKASAARTLQQARPEAF